MWVIEKKPFTNVGVEEIVTCYGLPINKLWYPYKEGQQCHPYNKRPFLKEEFQAFDHRPKVRCPYQEKKQEDHGIRRPYQNDGSSQEPKHRTGPERWSVVPLKGHQHE